MKGQVANRKTTIRLPLAINRSCFAAVFLGFVYVILFDEFAILMCEKQPVVPERPARMKCLFVVTRFMAFFDVKKVFKSVINTTFRRLLVFYNAIFVFQILYTHVNAPKTCQTMSLD